MIVGVVLVLRTIERRIFAEFTAQVVPPTADVIILAVSPPEKQQSTKEHPAKVRKMGYIVYTADSDDIA